MTRFVFYNSTETWTAVSIYQGPTIIKSCFFNNYVTKSWCLDDETSKECPDEELITRYAGAISFKRSNNYPSMTSTYVENNTFGYCDNVSMCVGVRGFVDCLVVLITPSFVGYLTILVWLLRLRGCVRHYFLLDQVHYFLSP